MKTPEEIVAELKSLGVDVNAWGETSPAETVLPTVERQRDALTRLRDTLEGMVAADQAAVLQLQEQIIRMERGGGH